MSQQLTLELSDEVFTDLQQKANAVGLSVTEWIVATLSDNSDDVNSDFSLTLHPAEARQRFRRHAGAISLGAATGVDNECIDADLAKAYTNEG